MKIHRFALLAALSLPTLAAADKPTKLSDADIATFAHVHAVNQMEIDMGNLAQKNGSTAVKKYGETLVKDHKSADKDLAALAKKEGLANIPNDIAEADVADHKAGMDAMTHLKTLKGVDFDKEFLPAMIDGHTKEVAKLDTAITATTDTAFSALLTKIKPVVQKHADDAKTLQTAIPKS